MGASAKGPRGRVTLGRTVPPYTECHENALQSYRHKQLNTQLQEYTEVPGEAIWWQRMQEKLSAAGAALRRKFVNLCNQRPPEVIRMHKIRFAPGLRPEPTLRSRMGRGKPPPHTSPPRCLRRLDLGAFGACCFAPNLFFVPARLMRSLYRS